MKVTYDPDVDVLRILFRDAPVEESDEDKPGVILDYDKDGNMVGMEVLNASQRVENPRGVEYAVTAQSWQLFRFCTELSELYCHRPDGSRSGEKYPQDHTVSY